MFGSAIVYTGLVITAAGVILFLKPIERLHVRSGSDALAIAGIGALLVGVGLTLPASESRVKKVESRLDEFMPAWQFRERHTIRIAAPPSDAIAMRSGDFVDLTVASRKVWRVESSEYLRGI